MNADFSPPTGFLAAAFLGGFLATGLLGGAFFLVATFLTTFLGAAFLTTFLGAAFLGAAFLATFLTTFLAACERKRGRLPRQKMNPSSRLTPIRMGLHSGRVVVWAHPVTRWLARGLVKLRLTFFGAAFEPPPNMETPSVTRTELARCELDATTPLDGAAGRTEKALAEPTSATSAKASLMVV